VTFWTAEIGSNHNGSLIRAVALMRKAKEIGCNAAKFQLFRIEEMYAPSALAEHPHLLERKRWELPLNWLYQLRKEADRLKIQLGLSIFSSDRHDYEQTYEFLDFVKISSYQIIDPLQFEAARNCCLPIVVSTGMATEEETLALRIYRNISVLLHCVSAYPAPAHEANLRSIQWLQENFLGRQIGWSDHTHSELVMHRAAHFYRANHIEFHLDLDGDGWEYSGGHCWLPDEIEKIIKGEPKYMDSGYYACDGKKTKAPTISETMEREWRADPLDGRRPRMSLRTKIASKSSATESPAS
jgi:sialic acid synthase SpsE